MPALRYVKRLSKKVAVPPYKELTGSNHVWVFWAQGKRQMPDIVKQCYKSIEKYCDDLQVHLLDLSSVPHYVELPDIIWKRLQLKQISLTLFSDVLRYALLQRYGGWWIDATILITNKIGGSKDKQLYTISQERTNRFLSKPLGNFPMVCP